MVEYGSEEGEHQAINSKEKKKVRERFDDFAFVYIYGRTCSDLEAMLRLTAPYLYRNE